MSETTIFLLELVVVMGMGVLAAIGGASPSRSLAAGLYALVTGALLVLVPYLTWEVARTDNAFLGLYLIGLLAAMFGALLTVRALVQPQAWWSRRAILAAGATAAVTAALALVLLVVRGPGAWRTGSGQFGLDVIVVDAALGLAAYFAAARLARRASRRIT